MTLHYILWSCCFLTIAASIRVILCVKRTTRDLDKLNEIILCMSRLRSYGVDRLNFICNEFSEINHPAYCRKLIFFRSPSILLGPALQMVCRGGGTPLGTLDNDRWWQVYEKAYLVQSRYVKTGVIQYMAIHNLELEYALKLFGCNVDYLLYPDKDNIQCAMAAAALEYDEAMAAQDIMSASRERA